MGRPKALLPLDGQPIVLHHVARLVPWAEEVAVVLGAEADAIGAVLPGTVWVVMNRDWARTHPLDSLRLALADEPSSALVLPVDVLPPHPATLAALAACRGAAVPVGPDGAEGHPVRLDHATIVRALRESAPGGLRDHLRGAVRVSVPVLVGADFDDPDAFARATALWRASP